MKILVTGGTGYIGSHVSVELLNEGYDVEIIDNLSNSSAEVVDSIERICGKRPGFTRIDLCEIDHLKSYFNKHPDFDAVVHFAAFKAVGESMKLPLKYYRNNISSLTNLLEVMKIQGIRNLVFSSSCTVYGDPDELPVHENSPVKPALSPYGNTKRISEEIIRDCIKTGNLNCISLRYFNPIGAHASALIGELPLEEPNNLLPYITQTAIGKRPFLRVYGNDYATHDGTAVRDYLHVADLAKAHVISLQRMIGGQCKDTFEVFNLGTGKGYSVMEIIQTFEKVSGLKLNYKIADRRAGDVASVWADTSYANRELGWETVLSLEEMIRSAWDWEKKLNNL